MRLAKRWLGWDELARRRKEQAGSGSCGECCCPREHRGQGTGTDLGLSAAPGSPAACTGTGVCLPAHTRAPRQGMKTRNLGDIWRCGQGFPDMQKVWEVDWSVSSFKSTWNRMIPQLSSACGVLPVLPSHFHTYPAQDLPVLTSCTLKKNVLLITEISFCAIQSFQHHLATVPGKCETCGASSVSITSKHSYGIYFPLLLHCLPYFKWGTETSDLCIYFFQDISSGCFKQPTLV